MYDLNSDIVRKAFCDSTVLVNTNEISLYTREIGELVVSSGFLVASDPFTNPNLEAFAFKFPLGTFPIDLAIAIFSSGDERSAFARVRFSESRVVQWEMALEDGQDLEVLNSDEFYGYGVDSGTGCFMDKNIATEYESRIDHDEDYFDDLIKEMDQSYKHTRSWLCFNPIDQKRENIVCFTSGWGDGCYPSFIGFDCAGQPVSLVTDLFVL